MRRLIGAIILGRIGETEQPFHLSKDTNNTPYSVSFENEAIPDVFQRHKIFICLNLW
ncbi:hypothetical protein FC82_GL000213 [Secundilactobacillus collinoides DSM 20515 = JCM 1123]|uniref:Uncharacterized protein n=1 Tax=Secundilactobacillus collinoides DSM 20515 = JCM 1123 TaxID=1423733 RepID=A0A0R2BCZ0_SECCO|nr:hypothetical protein FC82_GL000213 [Secundilactobacillus collinoides DSM 20515 = JCM 1123]